MKKLILLFIFNMMLAMASFAFAVSKNNFQFQIDDYHTQRQEGQTLAVYVRYAMKEHVDYSRYPDYRELRNIAMKYLEPTEGLPMNTFWEIIAAKLGQELLSRYPLSGVSIQFLVHPNEDGKISEPGFHGAIYTVGDVIPLDLVVMPTNHSQLKVQ